MFLCPLPLKSQSASYFLPLSISFLWFGYLITCCNRFFETVRSVDGSDLTKNKGTVSSRSVILPFNSFLNRGKVLIGSTYGFRDLLPKLCFLALLFLLSSPVLPGCLILSHTPSDTSVSITTMLLVCSPLGLPCFFLLSFVFKFNIIEPTCTISSFLNVVNY